MVEALRALRIPNLRWPGGCFADDYHWRDGIGPRDQRPRMVNSHWGDVVEDNAFGTHEFMALCELLGADPYVNGNVGSGTVREMSEWVEYLTRGRRLTDGGAAPGERPGRAVAGAVLRHRQRGVGLRRQPARGAFASLARQYATYVRNHGGNAVYRIAAGARDDDYDWTETLMRRSPRSARRRGDRGAFQGISLHYYTMAGPWPDKGTPPPSRRRVVPDHGGVAPDRAMLLRAHRA